jgi:hypothetical protein
MTENHGVGGSIPSPGTTRLFAKARPSLQKPQKSAKNGADLAAGARRRSSEVGRMWGPIDWLET